MIEFLRRLFVRSVPVLSEAGPRDAVAIAHLHAASFHRGWSETEIVAALRTGRRPDGRELSPAMPWRSYAAPSDADARAVAAYLKSLPASPHRVAGPATAATAPQPYLTMRQPADSADGN